jgi:hypothetical protein
MPRYFTLDQARAILPAISRDIREAVQAKTRYADAEAAMQDLAQRIMLRGGIAVDVGAVEGWKSQRESSANSLKRSMDRIEEAGVLVKDLDVGLIDFPTLYRGREVYLCYRIDEADIRFWHGVTEGFAGRKEIDRAFLDQHRGEDDAKRQ